MIFDFIKDSPFASLRDKLKDKFGEGFFTVFGICAFLFVMCGLVIGLLGRGWGYAWFFVVLGFVFAIFPVVNFILSNYEENLTPQETVIETPKEAKPKRDASKTKPQPIDESMKAALELEAAIARARLAKEKERKRKAREDEDRYEADKAAYLKRKAFEAEQKAQKQRQEEAERKKREENRKKQKEFNENYFKRDNIKKAGISSGYFKGVSNSDELKKRYKDLLKIYHPDNAAGDANVTRQIQKEYEELVPFYKAYDKHTN